MRQSLTSHALAGAGPSSPGGRGAILSGWQTCNGGAGFIPLPLAGEEVPAAAGGGR